MVRIIRLSWLALAQTTVFLVLATKMSGPLTASERWTTLNNVSPLRENNCPLLSDGKVPSLNGAGQCVRLPPDIHGSYIQGT